MRKKVLWLIPARSGSKSIPNKNIKLLGGIPLMNYRINSSIKTKVSSETWVSTDSSQYSEIAEKVGASVPFLRPAELSTDTASSSDVVIHAMNYAQDNSFEFEFIGLLEPTSPFITSDVLDRAINFLMDSDQATSIVAVKENRPNSIFVQEDDIFLKRLSRNLNGLKKLVRQSFKKEITPSGGFYISRWDSFLEAKTFYTENTMSFMVNDIEAIEIDEPIDWLFAEFILREELFNNKNVFISNEL